MKYNYNRIPILLGLLFIYLITLTSCASPMSIIDTNYVPTITSNNTNTTLVTTTKPKPIEYRSIIVDDKELRLTRINVTQYTSSYEKFITSYVISDSDIYLKKDIRQIDPVNDKFIIICHFDDNGKLIKTGYGTEYNLKFTFMFEDNYRYVINTKEKSINEYYYTQEVQ